jgi:hypothetical protein
MLSQLWPVYALALAMGLYTLKTIIASYIRYNRQDNEGVIFNITKTDEPFVMWPKKDKE